MKIERCGLPAHHQTPLNRTRSPCMPPRPPGKQTTTAEKMNHDNYVWLPAIPAWEKAFCYEVGLFKWDKFLEAKKVASLGHKVLGWDDSAVEEAFVAAKKRFFAKINGLPFDQPLPCPDLYIDEIVWDDRDARTHIHQNHVEHEGQDKIRAPQSIGCGRIEDINTTVWDVD